MKRILTILMVMALLAIPTVVLAEEAWVRVDTSKEVNGAWVVIPDNDVDGLARAWRRGGDAGSCNKQTWDWELKTHASVAQWIDWSVNDSEWFWQVRKPGVFCGDGIELTIKSNDDVTVGFCGFANLAPLTHTDQDPIPVWYAIAPTRPAPGDAGWMAPNVLNEYSTSIPYAEAVLGKTLKFWNKIQVSASQRACDYEDDGKVLISVTDLKPFIVPCTGLFNNDQPVAAGHSVPGAGV